MDLVHKISSLRAAALARPAGEWINLANQRLPGMITLSLVFVIAWFASQLLWAILPLQTEFDWGVRAPVSSSLSPVLSNVGDINYPAIAAAHIFGVPGAAPVIEQQTTDAPDTSLNLKLRGTIAAADPTYAHAIIADGKGQDDVYFIKDKVPGGTILEEIHPDRVILNRAGTLEALRLPKLSEALGNQKTPSRSVSNTSRPNTGQPANLRTRSSSAGFSQVFRPQPYMPNGQLKGYRIYPGRDRRKFAQLGFRPGDLVTEVNGQRLDSLQNGPMEIFGKMDSASSLTFTVERSGQPVVVTLDSDQMQSVSETEPD
jgi:general secretion pathway protein C